MHICAEIMYDTEGGGIHSDICLVSGVPYSNEDLTPETFQAGVSDRYRAFLHANLDEWLNKSNGTGIFYIGDLTYAITD